MNNPTPEPQSYIDAQAAARDTVLITPGSPLPSFVPEGAKTYYTRRGIVLTTDPRKAMMIDQGTDEDVAQALFGVRLSQDGTEEFAAVARNADGIPVAELAVKPEQMMQGLLAAQMNMPKGGLLSIEPKQELIAQRLKGLMQ